MEALNKMLKKILSLVSNFDRKLETKGTVGPEVQTIPGGDKPSGRGTEESSAGMDATSTQNPFPDPWEGDWNDAAANWSRINRERSL